MIAEVPTLRLHSLMLGVSDIAESTAFYTNKLGLMLRGSFGEFALLEADGFTITLSAQLARARPPAVAPVEIVLSVDGVRSAYNRLCERGVTFLSAPHTVDGTNDVAHFEDPDGHLFSLYGLP